MKLLECLMCCITTCGCKDTITNLVAFFPPNPPGYQLLNTGKTLRLILFDEEGRIIEPLNIPWIEISIITLTTSLNSKIPVIFYKNIHSECTIIFSHGNSTDIGLMYNYILDLAIQLKTNILLFEYTGYGKATGKPSEKSLYSDIRAAYEFLISINIDWKSIVLYGQSIGSAAVCDLASRCQVAGVILHSPLASGLHFIKEKPKKSTWYNNFCNISKISSIRCPVFIMHGTEDTDIPCFHGECLLKELKYPWSAWFPTAGHNNIEVKYRKVYLHKVNNFIENVIGAQVSWESNMDDLPQSINNKIITQLEIPSSKINFDKILPAYDDTRN
jgi:abhydrolase domain-containing protein 17